MSEQQQRQRISARESARESKDRGGSSWLRIPSDAVQFELDAKRRIIDVLCYTVGKGHPKVEPGGLWYVRDYFVHRGIGVDQRTFICPYKTAKLPCPVCEEVSRIRKDPKGDEELIKELVPRHRQVWNVIDVEDEEKGVQIFDVSFHLFGKRLYEEIENSDEADGFEYFADPRDGMQLRLGVTEKSFNKSKFYEVTSIQFRKRPKPYGKSILDRVYCLDDLLIVPTYEELRKEFLQSDDGGKPKADDDDWGSPTSKQSKDGGKPKTDDDDWGSPKGKENPSQAANAASVGSGTSQKEGTSESAATASRSDVADDDWGDSPAPAKSKSKKESKPEKSDDAKKDDGGDSPAPAKSEKAKSAKSDDWDDWG